MTCDASDFAVGAVLSQKHDDGEHPMAYEWRKMNTAEGNYPTHERELLADTCTEDVETLPSRQEIYCSY